MQGKKQFSPRLFVSVNLDDLVPEDNFYRKLAAELDLHYLYKATAHYYGTEGQASIDPTVFFKILLVGYLNNISSDRHLIAFCSDSLSIRLFLGYDIDEPLPWHSTTSRTRALYGEEVFLSLFRDVLKKCIDKGMVRGKRQAVDDAQHVITGACSDHADQRDSQCLEKIVELTEENLSENGLELGELLADGGYSSGEALAYLDAKNIDAYIPNFGQYKSEREGFTFQKEENYYQCVQKGGHHAKLLFKGERTDSKGYPKRTYRSSESDCKYCPLREVCCGKATNFKKLDDSIHKEHYDRMHQKLGQNPT